MANGSCFISYCHEDCDTKALDFLRTLIRDASHDAFDILFDTDLAYGEDLDKFMAHISTTDAVILLLSPAYKRKVLARQGGVYKEFSRIIARFQQLEAEKRKGKKLGEIEGYFDVIPILWSGDRESSLLSEVGHLKYLDLTSFRIVTDNNDRPILTDHLRKTLIPEINKVVDRIRFVTALKNPSFESVYQEQYGRLFLELKADWSNPRDLHHNYLGELFVKTLAYKQVRSQRVYFIIGRKGSGKSTVVDAMAIRHKDRYKGHIPIVADDFDLEPVYANLSSSKLWSDTRFHFRRLDCFRFAWEAFFYLSASALLVRLADDKQLSDQQTAYIPGLRDLLNKIIPDRESASRSEADTRSVLITHSFQNIAPFIDACIDRARSDPKFFDSDIKAGFTRDAFLSNLLGDAALHCFESIIVSCTRKFFITLDGFDTSFDLFRRRSIIEQNREDLNRRAVFEIEWLSALMMLVNSIKQGHRYTNRFHDLLEFCITVPRDRFFEVTKIDRDSYRYHSRFWALNWSGIELAILLRKRLEELCQSTTDKNQTQETRLERLWKAQYPQVPWEITITHGDRTITMPVFFYVLRHTFWRPREVLLYYAKILAAAKELKKKGLPVSSELIRRIVRDTTYEIIVSEFLNEFSSTVLNFEKIVQAFHGQRQFLSCEEIYTILSKVEMSAAIGSFDTRDVLDKIEFLYRLGLLGIEATAALRERYQIWHDHAFYFNEGAALFRGSHREELRKCRYIIHPIFSEYLELGLSDCPFVLNLTWEYLHSIEAVMATSGNDSLDPWSFSGIPA